MNNQKYYQTIFKRKSIRKYKQEPLTPQELKNIQEQIKKTTPLYPEIKTEIKIQTNKEIRILMPLTIPYYLTIYSENKPGHLTNAGYILQQLDLYLSANQIGTCWLGMAKPRKGYKKLNNLEYIIVIGFGTPDDTIHRDNIKQFHRKPLKEITTITDAEKLLEPVRIAPSASNRQPWHLTGTKNKITLERIKPNKIASLMYNHFSIIDMGIALQHLKISAEHQGKTINFQKEENTTSKKGYEYIITAYIN